MLSSATLFHSADAKDGQLFFIDQVSLFLINSDKVASSLDVKSYFQNAIVLENLGNFIIFLIQISSEKPLRSNRSRILIRELLPTLNYFFNQCLLFIYSFSGRQSSLTFC